MISLSVNAGSELTAITGEKLAVPTGDELTAAGGDDITSINGDELTHKDVAREDAVCDDGKDVIDCKTGGVLTLTAAGCISCGVPTWTVTGDGERDDAEIVDGEVSSVNGRDT